ncbi:MAG: hypothetical protein AB7E59_04290 [Pusillimonas sp.]
MVDNSEIVEAARILRGDPNPGLSKPDDVRYGSKGSLSLKPSVDTFFDHESNIGGGVLDFVVHSGQAGTQAEAARWLESQGIRSAKPATKGRKTEQVYPYRDASGNEVFRVIRMTQADGSKTFRQCRVVDGKTVWNLAGVERVLYRLPELLAAPAESPVFIVEGEKDVHSLEAVGLVATTNAGGAKKWRDSYASAFKGRNVVVLPDNDAPGREHAEIVAKALAGVAATVKVLALPGLPEKGDVSDWLAGGGDAQTLLRLAEGAAPSAVEEEKERKPSQTDLVVAFVKELFNLVHDENRDALAVAKDTREVFRVNSRAFRDKLLSGFYGKYEMAVRDGSLREAMMTVQALARATGEPRKANLRVACVGDEWLLDLGVPGNSRTVSVTPGRWEIIDRPGAMFVRGDSMLPLPDPVPGGDVALLWRIANVPEPQRILVLTWLVDCLRPETPYPLLELIGEQGSGKSVTAEALRRLIDPNSANLRAEPKSAEDLFVISGHNHVVALENVSRLTPQQQDAACILATGGGFAKRKLYSDTDEVVISLRRPVMINGIVAAVTQQDLVDRCISIECPVLEGRAQSVLMWRDFDRNLPAILGGLLDLAAKALQRLPHVDLPERERPRLAEYAILGCAVAEVLGLPKSTFMDAFNAMRAETVGRTLEASPVAVAVQELIEAQAGGITAPLKDVLHALETYKPQGTDAWPRSAKGLGDALRRAAPALRSLGIECRSLGKGSGGVVRWSIQRKSIETKSHKSQVPNPAEGEKLGHGTCGTSETQVSSEWEVI